MPRRSGPRDQKSSQVIVRTSVANALKAAMRNGMVDKTVSPTMAIGAEWHGALFDEDTIRRLAIQVKHFGRSLRASENWNLQRVSLEEFPGGLQGRPTVIFMLHCEDDGKHIYLAFMPDKSIVRRNKRGVSQRG